MLHLDEQPPHIHATVVHIDAAGKLNCRAMLGDRQKMCDMQTNLKQSSYAGQFGRRS